MPRDVRHTHGRSVAFYPNDGLILFGSEAAATKAGMLGGDGEEEEDMDASKSGQAFRPDTHELKGVIRLDLDDVAGESILVRWGDAHGESLAEKGVGDNLPPG